MSKATPYKTYCMFLSLKTHFKIKGYDYFLYGGKSRTTPEKFESRKDKWLFYKLASLCSEDDLEDYLVSNFINDKVWVGEFLEDSAQDNFSKYKKRKQSLTYHYENDLIHLFELASDNPKKLTSFVGGQYPLLILECMNKNIGLDSLVILNQFLAFSDKFDQIMGDDLLWSKMRLKLQKYKPFVNYDKEKMKKVLKNKIYILDKNTEMC